MVILFFLLLVQSDETAHSEVSTDSGHDNEDVRSYKDPKILGLGSNPNPNHYYV